MTSSAMRGFRRGLALAATGIIFAGRPALAQDVDEPAPEPQHSQLPPGAVVQSLDTGPGAELRRNLSTLASNPRSLEALIGAGRAAIGLRDGEAASGFFTRAQEIAPEDPRVKAGLASAALLSGRPEQALILFAEAVQRGAPEAELAGDRGLAYDMVGDPRRAQQDYAIALRHRNDPEIERRLALSLAISGQRDAALRVIDAQLRRRDRAAWRTQAFVLALTGDPAGADDTARRMMPTPNAEALAPFFARLAYLSPAQKAAAVNFGIFPSDGRTRAATNVDTRADPGALALAQGGPRPQPPLAEPLNGGRRRPGVADQASRGYGRGSAEVAPAVQPSRRLQIAQAQPRRFQPQPQNSDDEDRQDEEAQAQETQSRPAPVARPREAPAFVPGGNFTLDSSRQQAAPAPPPPTPGFGSVGPSPSVRQFQSFTLQPRTPTPGSSPPAMSEVATAVRALPTEQGAASAPPPLTLAQRQARDAAARAAEARYRSGAAGPVSGGGGRHWAQIAHGAQRAALALQYRQVRAQAPGLIGSHNAWTAADHGTNRLLIGPFDSAEAAQDYIGELGEQHVAAILWESGAGSSPERLPGGGASGASHARTETPAASHTARTRHAAQGSAASEDSGTGHGRRSRSGHAAADEGRAAHGRGRRASSDDEDPPSSRSRGHTRSGHGRSSDDEDQASSRSRSHTRSGHGRGNDEDDQASSRSRSHGRSSHGRNSDDEESASSRTHSRSGHGRGNSDDSASSSRSHSAHRRGGSDDNAHSSRNRSSQERSAHDTRTSRSRSSAEQGPAPHRRRPR